MREQNNDVNQSAIADSTSRASAASSRACFLQLHNLARGSCKSARGSKTDKNIVRFSRFNNALCSSALRANFVSKFYSSNLPFASTAKTQASKSPN